MLKYLSNTKHKLKQETVRLELDEQIRSLSTEQLENLSEALLDFTAKSELLVWLQANAERRSGATQA